MMFDKLKTINNPELLKTYSVIKFFKSQLIILKFIL